MLYIPKNSWPCFRATWQIIPKQPHRVVGLQGRYFSRKFSQTSSEESFVEALRYPPILPPLLFAVVVSGGVLGAAAYATNRDTEKWARSLMSTNAWNIFAGPPTNEDLRRARQLQLYSYVRVSLDKIKTWLGDSPNYVSRLAAYTYAEGVGRWVGSAEGRRVCRTIIAINSAIWLAWQIPRLRPMMTRHFLHYPLSGLSHTLLTSVFSHKSLLHLVCNSMALSGFGSTALLYLSLRQERNQDKLRESTARYHFLSFLVSAGLFSSFLSHAVRVRFYYPRIISQLSSAGPATAATTTGAAFASAGAQAAATTPTIIPSLGASGAIWACVSLTALAFPDAQMALFIPSSFSIPIQTGALGMVALDVIGIVRGWRFFDHWAHLGGATFGVFYYMFGPHIWEEARRRTKPPQIQRLYFDPTRPDNVKLK